MRQSFDMRLAEVGIHPELIRDILERRLAIASGPIVTQAVFGEIWPNATLFILLETSPGSVDFRLKADGYTITTVECDCVTYTKDINTFNSPNAMVMVTKAKIAVVKYDARNSSRHRVLLNFTNDTFDGKTFSVLDATKERIKLCKEEITPQLEHSFAMCNFKVAPVQEEESHKTVHTTIEWTINA